MNQVIDNNEIFQLNYEIIVSSVNLLLQLFRQFRNLRMSRNELLQLQEKKLRSIIDFAYHHIPHYHRKFRRHGVHPSDIRLLKDIHKIPVTTKNELATLPLKEWVPYHIDPEKCFLSKTSGSTGTITVTAYNSKSYAEERAITYRSILSSGLRISDRMLEFGSITSAKLKPKWFQRMGIFQKLQISILESSDYKIAVAQKYDPDILYGYPSDLITILKRIEESPSKFSQPRIVMTTGETLPARMREELAYGYNAKVLDQFGCVEMGRTAWECPTHSGYHMNIDSFLIEFLDGQEEVSPGAQGEIVYTNLYNHTMPLIRYQVEDIGVKGEESCKCGLSLPLMQSIEGRKNDFLQRRDGSIVSPRVIVPYVLYGQSVQQYRIIQKSNGNLIVLVVFKDRPPLDFENTVIDNISAKMGPNISVSVKIVPEIDYGSISKRRFVMSDVTGTRNEIADN